MPTIIAVAGPPGSGKTTWIRQRLQGQEQPCGYLAPGLGNVPVDPARIGYCNPWVTVVEETQMATVLAALPEAAQIYVELGFQLDLRSPLCTTLPDHRVAVLPSVSELDSPPGTAESTALWSAWAEEIVTGTPADSAVRVPTPEIWRAPLTGQVFDPPSLDEVLIELTGGAYGAVQRLKGIFELPDGRAFHVDFVSSLTGLEYTELPIPRWLTGRPQRFSGIEIVGAQLMSDVIRQTLLDCCITTEAITQYQAHYNSLDPMTEAVGR